MQNQTHTHGIAHMNVHLETMIIERWMISYYHYLISLITIIAVSLHPQWACKGFLACNYIYDFHSMIECIQESQDVRKLSPKLIVCRWIRQFWKDHQHCRWSHARRSWNGRCCRRRRRSRGLVPIPCISHNCLRKSFLHILFHCIFAAQCAVTYRSPSFAAWFVLSNGERWCSVGIGRWNGDGKLFKLAIFAGGSGKRTPGRSELDLLSYEEEVCTLLTNAVMIMCL